MSLVAEFRLVHPDIPTIAPLERTDGMELTAEHVVADDPGSPIVFFWADGERFDAFEAGLDDAPQIADWERIEALDGRRLYRVDVDGDESVVIYPTDLAVGASRLGFSATADGLGVRTRFPDREAMERYFRRCREQGIEVSLERLCGGDRDDDFVAVSEKQREALRVAAESGYFAVPRETDLGALAEELDISTQSASERLRRGTAALVGEAFGVDDA
ncbi:helix-turn-helix domain-containing protein [Halobaculum lipolyticum]|uniref:Helix-turn-helix domain-containing protein n=1 Tax=Halobaculum lipolyticum TaxID=3032001 RepID=A0ABD5WFR2_9EURY|nr:helix-turn-helix domain-containing protein [Halobaculum sp. DT31]